MVLDLRSLGSRIGIVVKKGSSAAHRYLYAVYSLEFKLYLNSLFLYQDSIGKSKARNKSLSQLFGNFPPAPSFEIFSVKAEALEPAS